MRGGSAKPIGMLGVAAVGCVIAALQSGCAPKFDGPYPCATGYASCATKNACESALASDGDNCGKCGQACGLGARCTKSKCGAVAERVATFEPGAQTAIAVNSSGVFWLDQSTIFMVPLAGGVPTVAAANVRSCSSASFAVNDDSLYYLWTGSPPDYIAGLTKLSLSTRTEALLMPNAKDANECGSVAIDAENIYVWTPGGNPTGPSNTFTLSKIPMAGGAPVTLATLSTGSVPELSVAGDVVLTPERQSDGSDVIRAVPIAGGKQKTIPINLNLGGFNAFTADADNVYVVGSSCGSCSKSDNGGSSAGSEHPPMGAVGKIRLDGSHAKELAQVTGQALSIAVDAKYVYWSTETAVWRAPIAGGDAVPIAGGLSVGMAAIQCSGVCNNGQTPSVRMPIAVDATSVYILDSVAGAVLKVPK